MLERKMIFNKFALSILRLMSPLYIGIREDREPVHVVEVSETVYARPFSGRKYLDVRITYLTKDGRFFTLPDTVFYKFYGRKV